MEDNLEKAFQDREKVEINRCPYGYVFGAAWMSNVHCNDCDPRIREYCGKRFMKLDPKNRLEL